MIPCTYSGLRVFTAARKPIISSLGMQIILELKGSPLPSPNLKLTVSLRRNTTELWQPREACGGENLSEEEEEGLLAEQG